jgi:ApaG protein
MCGVLAGRYRGGVSSAVTEGIRVEARSSYEPERSAPSARRYLFSYRIRIGNEGTRPAQLVSRHWIITDGHGEREEVAGEGVVGQQPRLEPGQSFEYTSYCVLETTHGSMHGTYQLVRDDGSRFDAEIPQFTLAMPGSLN